MKTMICLILDRSGSMRGREADVIGGVNTFIEEQKKLPDAASIAFVRFDSEAIERFRPMTALADVKPMQNEEFVPRAWTPLLDAVGQTITKLDEDWKQENPERAIVVIVTDGEENASREYTKQKISEMIKARQDSGKWAFIYLGANVDAFAEAATMGISAANTANYRSTVRGTAAMYSNASASVGRMRSTGQTVAHNMGGFIEEDGTLTKPGSAPGTIIINPPSLSNASFGNATPVWVTPEATPWKPPV